MKLGKNCEDFITGRRKLKIQVRISPNGKSKMSRPASKSKSTGARAARRDYPQSTNVSSPVQAASRRRQVLHEWDDPKTEHVLHRNGYARDNFVVSDDEAYNSEVNDEEGEEDFGSIREAGKPQRTTRRRLGPPITTDEKLERLNSTHRMFVEDFMIHARKMSNDVSLINENNKIRLYVLIITDPHCQRPSTCPFHRYYPSRDGYQFSKRYQHLLRLTKHPRLMSFR